MSWRTTIIQVKWPNENGPPTINIFLLLELSRKSTGRRCLYNYSFSSSVNLSGWYYFGNEWSTRNDVSDWFSCRQRPYFVRDHALARSRVHLRQPGAFSTNMHASLGGTSLSFLRLLSNELSCHLVIFLATTIANDKGRSKKKKLESHVWCLDDVVRMPATRLPFVVWRAFLQLSVVCWRGWSFADAIQRHHTEASSNFSKQIIVWNRHVRFRFNLYTFSPAELSSEIGEKEVLADSTQLGGAAAAINKVARELLSSACSPGREKMAPEGTSSTSLF